MHRSNLRVVLDGGHDRHKQDDSDAGSAPAYVSLPSMGAAIVVECCDANARGDLFRQEIFTVRRALREISHSIQSPPPLAAETLRNYTLPRRAFLRGQHERLSLQLFL